VTQSAPCLSPELARALAARLRDAIEAGERLASFVFDDRGEADRPAALADGEELAAAHDFVLRVLHGASDPLNYRILGAVAAAQAHAGLETGAAIDALAAEVDLVRLSLLERVNDLIQLGLIARDLQRDSVLLSPAGAALFETVAELDAEVARWLTKRRRR
jgi:hypothetical protein